MTNPLTLLSMLDKIKFVLQNSKCSNIRFIWVSTAPSHKCIHSMSSCVHDIDNTWENIYAINAVNQFFRTNILNISAGYPSRLTIIDRYDMVLTIDCSTKLFI